MLRQYFNYKERLEIFLIFSCNILWYVGFVIIFAVTGIRTDLPIEFLPNPNWDVNHYATEHL